jgi:integrase
MAQSGAVSMSDDKPKKKRERGQGSIGKVRGSRFLYIWYYDNAGNQHRESTKSTLRSVAQEMLNQRLAAMGRGEKSPTEIKGIRYEDMRQILINHYREAGIGELVEEKQRDGTVKVYPHKRNLKVLDEFFGGMRLDQMDTDVLRAFRKTRRDDGIDDSTINRNLSILRRMMNVTIQERNLQFAKPYFPMVSEAGKVRQGFVTPERFGKLISKMNSRLKPYTQFLYEDVSRTTAAKDIRWSWVDLKEGVIEIPKEITKTGEAQILPLSDELINLLKKQFRQDDAPVFDTTNFRKEFQQACVAAGLGKITKMVSPKGYKWEKYEGVIPHDFRRSGIRNLVRAGVPEKVAMSISGHKTRAVFDRYNITSTDDVKDAIKSVTRYNKKKAGK